MIVLLVNVTLEVGRTKLSLKAESCFQMLVCKDRLSYMCRMCRYSSVVRASV